MILFVFEGEKREPTLFETIQKLYSFDETVFYFTYNTSFHKLYKELKQHDMSLFRVLQEEARKRKDDVFGTYTEIDFSEIYLFFDYDFHNQHVSLEMWNNELREMLAYFNEETGNGKMYVNYPMIESIRYTKELPDSNYKDYTIKRSDCCDFKKIASDFSFYRGLDFILLSNYSTHDEVKKNWELLKKQNVSKANYICNGVYAYPGKKILFSQENILETQIEKFVGGDVCCVSILNALPLFIYDYFKNQ